MRNAAIVMQREERDDFGAECSNFKQSAAISMQNAAIVMQNATM